MSIGAELDPADDQAIFDVDAWLDALDAIVDDFVEDVVAGDYE